VLGGALIYGGTSQGAVNAGTYVIAPSGQTSTNYTLTFVNGILTVKLPSFSAASSVLADPQTIVVSSLQKLNDSVTFAASRASQDVVCKFVGGGQILCGSADELAAGDELFSRTDFSQAERLASAEPRELACRMTGAGKVVCQTLPTP
jgi:hypothetical protein